MSAADSTAHAAPVEGVVVCDATAALCSCALPHGHDGPHECDRELCGGRWSGSFGNDDFAVHRFPFVRPTLIG